MKEPWPRVRIDELCERIVDCLNRTAPIVEEPTEFKMIRTTNVRDGWIDLSEVRCVDEPTFNKWTRRERPRRGDIVLTREAPLGEVGMVRTDDAVFLGQRTVLYRANPKKLDTRYLLYAFQGEDLKQQIRAFGSGSTVEHMRVPDAKELLVPLPDLKIQSRIGEILGSIDDLIENNARRIAILEDIARRLFEEWFVRFRAPGLEQVPNFKMKAGNLPHGWQRKRLKELLDARRDATMPGEHLSGRAYIPIDCIGKRTLYLPEVKAWSEAQSSLLLIEPGDVLFGAMRAYFHKVCISPLSGVTRSTCFVLRPYRPEWTAFSALCLCQDSTIAFAAAHSRGATIPYAVWDGSLAELEVVFPPSDVLERFNKIVDPIISFLKNMHFIQKNLRTQRDLLLPKLISGEIDVSRAECVMEAAE